MVVLNNKLFLPKDGTIALLSILKSFFNGFLKAKALNTVTLNKHKKPCLSKNWVDVIYIQIKVKVYTNSDNG